VLPSVFPTKRSDPELYPVRSGLVFGFFNALTWQIALGTPLVLFAQLLGASALEVGLATSFVLLLTPVQIFSTALLPRYGFKRVMLGGWGSRSLFLVVPLMLGLLAPWMGVGTWMAPALVWSIFFFSLARSVGAASFNPWIYAIVPPAARGRYFANDQFTSSLGGIFTLLLCLALFHWLPVYQALLIQYAVALDRR
jgi:MFS family permease